MATDKRERQRANRAEKQAAEAKVQRRQHYFALAKKYGGYALLIVIGLMLVTNRLTLIAIWAQQNGLYLDLPLGGATSPTYLIAMTAGLLSFLSPCVLPLVPAYVGFLSGQALASD